MTFSDYSMSEKIFSENTVNAFIKKTSKPILVIIFAVVILLPLTLKEQLSKQGCTKL
jgi:preprotein translocase subunit SecG